jgi:hypothetical protein
MPKLSKNEVPLEEFYSCKCGSKEDRVEENYELVCPDCGLCDDNRITNDFYYNYNWLSNENDNIIQKKKEIYDTFKYFEKILASIQSNERVKIPNRVINSVKENVSIINYINVREHLSRIDESKYYPHIFTIIYEITGKKLVFPEQMILDLKVGVKILLREWFLSKFNNTKKKFLPIQFVCIEFLKHLDSLYKLPYNILDWLHYFKNLKRKRYVQNLEIFTKLLKSVDFSSHYPDLINKI